MNVDDLMDVFTKFLMNLCRPKLYSIHWQQCARTLKLPINFFIEITFIYLFIYKYK